MRAILPAPIAEPFAVDWLFRAVHRARRGLVRLPLDRCRALRAVSAGRLRPRRRRRAVVGRGHQHAALRRAAARPISAVPEEVLGSLNQAYQMDDHNGMYFTIWYGVYHRPSGRLRYASAGHPPPILVSGPRGERGEVTALSAQGPHPRDVAGHLAITVKSAPWSRRPGSFSSATASTKSRRLMTACCRSRRSRRCSRAGSGRSIGTGRAPSFRPAVARGTASRGRFLDRQDERVRVLVQSTANCQLSA